MGVRVVGVLQAGDFAVLSDDRQEHRVDANRKAMTMYASVPTRPGDANRLRVLKHQIGNGAAL